MNPRLLTMLVAVAAAHWRRALAVAAVAVLVAVLWALTHPVGGAGGAAG